MRKWIGWLLVLLLILACLPAGFGLIAKKSLEQVVADLPLPEGVTLTVDDYIFGWLNSYVAIKIHVPKNEAQHHYIEAQALDITVHGHMVHGPLLATDQGIQWGFARLNTHATVKDIQGLNAKIAQELAVLFNDDAILRAQSLFYFSRDIAIDLKSSPINANQQGDNLQWNGLTAQIKINKAFDMVHMNATLSPILFTTAKNALLDAAQMQFAAKLSRQAQQPWVGEQMFTIPTFYLKDEMGAVLRFDHLEVRSTSSLLNDLLQASLNIEADNIEFNQKQFKTLQFDLDIADFASKPLFAMGQLLQKAAPLSAQDKQALVELITQALLPGADVKLDYQLTTQDQQVYLHALLNFPDIAQQAPQSLALVAQALLKDMSAKVAVQVPANMLKEILLENAAIMFAAGQGGVALSMDEINQFSAKIDALLAQLLQMGVLMLQNNNYQLNLNYQQGNFELNNKMLSQQDMFLLLMLLPQALANESISH